MGKNRVSKKSIGVTETGVISFYSPWVFMEIVPILFGIILVGAASVAVVTESIALSTWNILFIVGVVVSGGTFFENVRRKRGSTLFFEVSSLAPSYSFSVWMRKPNQFRWKNRLDEGKNGGSFEKFTHIVFGDFNGVSVMKFFSGVEHSPVIVPLKLFSYSEQVRHFFREGTQKYLDNIMFQNVEDSVRFTEILAGNVQEVIAELRAGTGEVSVPVNKKNAAPVVNEVRTVPAEPLPVMPSSFLEGRPVVDAVVEGGSVKVGGEVVEVTKPIGYNTVQRRSVGEQVDEYFKKMDENK